ncbi:MAG TPA: GMC family oxidoreductase [Mycobacteriales bacterium]|nr:GMC family oxidoreductase [Mycobacteriales bacterium]
MRERAIVIGSGAGASVTSMVLAHNGWDVVVFEKGPAYIHGWERPGPIKTVFSNDELKFDRNFDQPDPISEPRTFRNKAGDALTVGVVDPLASVVGGGTTHWDAKVPRFWDIDFSKLSMLGPIDGADIEDWPFDYDEIAPYYQRIERLMGVQGDQASIPQEPTLKHAPGKRGFVMPPGPQQLASTTIADGCRTLGLHPYPFPSAINSRHHLGRPACNDCGQCSDYGCPNGARIGALAVMQHAVQTGHVTIHADTMVDKVLHNGKRATAVRYIDKRGKRHTMDAKIVVLSCSAIESSRLALLSHLPNPHDRIGRDMMFHSFMDGFGIFTAHRMHAYRGRSITQCCEDFADPDFPGARAFAKLNGLPYIRGGIMEIGGSEDAIGEAQEYQFILSALGNAPGVKPFGTAFKSLMRTSLIRDRLAGVDWIGEDLPYATNRVELDAKVKDYRGVPVPRLTYSQGKHEQVAAEFYLPLVTALLKAAGADSVSASLPESIVNSLTGANIPHGAHVMGGMRMGKNPKTSATDGTGKVHGMENVFVADGSVFPSSGAQNPTLTIMATALRNATKNFGKGADHLGRDHEEGPS